MYNWGDSNEKPLTNTCLEKKLHIECLCLLTTHKSNQGYNPYNYSAQRGLARPNRAAGILSFSPSVSILLQTGVGASRSVGMWEIPSARARMRLTSVGLSVSTALAWWVLSGPGLLPFTGCPPVRPDYVLNPPMCRDGCGKNARWREPSGAAETWREQPGDSTPLEW